MQSNTSAKYNPVSTGFVTINIDGRTTKRIPRSAKASLERGEPYLVLADQFLLFFYRLVALACPLISLPRFYGDQKSRFRKCKNEGRGGRTSSYITFHWRALKCVTRIGWNFLYISRLDLSGIFFIDKLYGL